jgi:nucleoporin SEH1
MYVDIPILSSFALYPNSNSNLQAKWFHPTTGTHLASIGNDRILRIFTLDPSAAPRSGRTFIPIAQISSKTPYPFVSLDLKNVSNVYTYLAAIDRAGLLTVYVPESPDKFTEWKRLAQFSVCVGAVPPSNGEETSFKVRFDPNIASLAYINSLTDAKDTLRLVATSMDTIKVYHALLSGPAGSSSTEFHEAASLTLTPGVLIRDVQWAPFNVRGVDLLATASRDGAVSIVEMSHTLNPESINTNNNSNDNTNQNSEFPRQTSARPPPPQSSLTTAIAGRNGASIASSSRPSTSPASTRALPYATHLKVVTTIPHAHDDAWSLAWDPAGQVLMSNGSEGRTSMWKKSIVEGEWKEFSSTEFEVQEDGAEEGEEEWVT